MTPHPLPIATAVWAVDSENRFFVQFMSDAINAFDFWRFFLHGVFERNSMHQKQDLLQKVNLEGF
jgi:hypothetical protein